MRITRQDRAFARAMHIDLGEPVKVPVVDDLPVRFYGVCVENEKLGRRLGCAHTRLGIAILLAVAGWGLLLLREVFR